MHPNGAVGITGLAFAHEFPEDAARFPLPFLGATKAREDGIGLTIEVAPRAALRERHEVATIAAEGAPLALMRISVADIAETRRVLDESGVAWRPAGDLLAIGADEAMGAAILFEQQRAV